MASKVIMPQGGQDLTTGRVIRWLKQEGEPVKKGEVLCEVETEKAVFEVNSPNDGSLLRIVVPQGVETAIFATIGIVGQPGEAVELEDPRAAEHAVQTKESTGARLAREADGGEKTKISPKARRLADEQGIDLQTIVGTGPQGRIVEKDISDYVKRHSADPVLSGPPNEATGDRIVPLTKYLRIVGRKMQRSKQLVPHFYVSVSVNMTNAVRLKATLNEHGASLELVSVTDMIARACALALREFPMLNSSFEDEDNLVYWSDINIGIAVALDDGLMVPVLEKADELSLLEIAQQSQRNVRLARGGKQPSLIPGRFTVSNLGMHHVESFAAIINPPETAILAVGSIERRVVPGDNDAICVREMLTMTLSVDHRAADGVLAARFLNRVKSLLESPEGLL